MDVIISTSQVLLEKTEAGVLLISGTRIPIDTVVFAFHEGATPEEIVFRYPTLDLTQVYAVISYYLQHREEIEVYLTEREKQHAEIKTQIEARFNPQGIRERLLARKRSADNGK